MPAATPSAGPRQVRLALLASVAAGASLTLAGELAFLAARGSPAQTTVAIPVIAVVVGAAGMLIAAALARNEASIRTHAERIQLIGDPVIALGSNSAPGTTKPTAPASGPQGAPQD